MCMSVWYAFMSVHHMFVCALGGQSGIGSPVTRMQVVLRPCVDAQTRTQVYSLEESSQCS